MNDALPYTRSMKLTLGEDVTSVTLVGIVLVVGLCLVRGEGRIDATWG